MKTLIINNTVINWAACSKIVPFGETQINISTFDLMEYVETVYFKDQLERDKAIKFIVESFNEGHNIINLKVTP